MAWVSQVRAAELLGISPRALRRKNEHLIWEGVCRMNGARFEYQTVGLGLAWMNGVGSLQAANIENFERIERIVMSGRELG